MRLCQAFSAPGVSKCDVKNVSKTPPSSMDGQTAAAAAALVYFSKQSGPARAILLQSKRERKHKIRALNKIVSFHGQRDRMRKNEMPAVLIRAMSIFRAQFFPN